MQYLTEKRFQDLGETEKLTDFIKLIVFLKTDLQSSCARIEF